LKKKLIDENHVQSIGFIVEGLEKIPYISSAIEYMEYCDYYFQNNYSENYPKFLVTDLGTGLVGNRTFLVQSITIEDSPNTKRFQKTYSAQFDKYLLNIIVDYTLEDQFKENELLLKQVKWYD
jgi:hypothetical protein